MPYSDENLRFMSLKVSKRFGREIVHNFPVPRTVCQQFSTAYLNLKVNQFWNPENVKKIGRVSEQLFWSTFAISNCLV